MQVIWGISAGELLILLILVPLISLFQGLIMIRVSEYASRITSIEGAITQINKDIGGLTRALAITDAAIATSRSRE